MESYIYMYVHAYIHIFGKQLVIVLKGRNSKIKCKDDKDNQKILCKPVCFKNKTVTIIQEDKSDVPVASFIYFLYIMLYLCFIFNVDQNYKLVFF